MKTNLLILILLVSFSLFIPHKDVAKATNNPSKEIFLEETLLLHYSPYFFELTNGNAYYCEKITNINRINESNRQHKIQVQFITYQGAHNPPYDLYTVTLKDMANDKKNPTKVKIIEHDIEENISNKTVESICN